MLRYSSSCNVQMILKFTSFPIFPCIDVVMNEDLEDIIQVPFVDFGFSFINNTTVLCSKKAMSYKAGLYDLVLKHAVNFNMFEMFSFSLDLYKELIRCFSE